MLRNILIYCSGILLPISPCQHNTSVAQDAFECNEQHGAGSRPVVYPKPRNSFSQTKELKPTQETLDLCTRSSIDSALLRLPIDTRKDICEHVSSTGETIFHQKNNSCASMSSSPKEKEKERRKAKISWISRTTTLSFAVLSTTVRPGSRRYQQILSLLFSHHDKSARNFTVVMLTQDEMCGIVAGG